MIDLRLVAPALAAWAVTGLSLSRLVAIDDLATRHRVANVTIVAALAAAVVVGVVLWRQPGALVAAAAGLLALVSVGVQVAAWTSPTVQESFGEDVRIEARVSGPPREAIGVSYLPVRTRVIERTTPVEIDVPVSVVVSESSRTWTPPVGAFIEATGRLRPAGASLDTAAYFDIGDGPLTVVGEPGAIDHAAQRVREGLIASLPSEPAAGAALVAGLAIGDENTMSPRLRDAMRSSGLAHLTAVSGGNVAIVVGVVLAIAWLLRMPLWTRVVLALAALGFYVVVVHPQPSVLRAGVMGVVVVLSLLVGGRRAGPSVLATAVIVLVVLVPPLALSWGFALSVAATGGIVMMTPVLRSRIQQTALGQRLPSGVVIAISLTVAAQLATAPVLLAMGASVGVASVPANLLAMPAVPLVTIAGLAAALFHTLLPVEAFAGFIAWVGAMAGEWIAQVAFVAGGIEVLRFRGSVGSAIAAVLAVLGVVLAWRRGARSYVIAGMLVAAFAAVLWAVWPPAARSWPPPGWVMMQCDVGQGDGFVIAGAGGRDAVVVDTGRSAREIDTCLQDLGIRHIAVLVLTHFHADHVAGLTGVLRGREVDAVLATGLHEPQAQWLGVDRILAEHGLAVQRIDAGARFHIGQGHYTALWPRRFIRTGTVSSGSVANNASVVLDIHAHGLRVLLTGDIEPPAQAAILAERGGFDLVKIPHHGSPHQHPDFATWANADAAVVSVGEDNEFGHPAASTLEAWQSSGAIVLRTDVHGDIAVVVDPDDPGRWSVVPRQ